jgi:UDP-N-acetyl-D-galactosamine dehydrogenase
MSHMKDKTVSVVGLGYVGLPLAEAFSKHLKVIGFDIDEEKTRNLGKNKNDNENNLEFTTDPSRIKLADFVIIAVPTHVTKSNLMRQTCDMSNFFASKNLY